MIPEFFISTHKCSDTCSVQKHHLSPQRQLLRLHSKTWFHKDHLQKQILIHLNKCVAIIVDLVPFILQLWEFLRATMVSSTLTHTNHPVWPQCWQGHFQSSNTGSKGPCGYVWHMNYITEAKIKILYYMTLGHEGRPALKKKLSNTMNLSTPLRC